MVKQEIRNYRGMRDFLPEDMRRREYVFGILEEIFKAHGFEKIETPAIELWEILSGKYGEEEKLIYRFKDRKGRDIGLRYDLTVPLARVVAQHKSELTFPFKRYQMERVWRADRPQKGRYREFYQCDVDIVGTKSMLADAEVISVIYETLKRLNFKNFIIRINNRKLIKALYEKIGEGSELEVARAVDKMDKKGPRGVKEELLNRGISPSGSDIILKAMEIKDIKEAKSFYGNCEGVMELEELFSYLVDYGILEEHFAYDPSLARGLDYYTGPIFETVVRKPRIGSITGGGRYDGLIGAFRGAEIPATGTSLGVERLIAVMEELSMFPTGISSPVDVIVCHFAETKGEAVKIASKLRAEGIRTDLYTGEKDLRAQLGYAAGNGISFVVIVGDEVKEGKVVLKNLRSRKQKILSLQDVISEVKNFAEVRGK